MSAFSLTWFLPIITVIIVSFSFHSSPLSITVFRIVFIVLFSNKSSVVWKWLNHLCVTLLTDWFELFSLVFSIVVCVVARSPHTFSGRVLYSIVELLVISGIHSNTLRTHAILHVLAQCLFIHFHFYLQHSDPCPMITLSSLYLIFYP